CARADYSNCFDYW
nr:immunoglobulin heavy chain junction region [Mus musculus]